MPKYIELDTALKVVSDITSDPAIKHTGKAIRKRLKELPEVDVVEVKRLSPCDLCMYNPPSSGDGKPCIMCAASAKTDGATDTNVGAKKEGAE